MRKASFATLFLLLAAGLCAHAESDDFAPCRDASADPHLAGSLCAHFQVPGEKVMLFLRQFPAGPSSRGQVWLVAGESAAALYPQIEALRQDFPGYDLILPDRREPARVAAHDLQAEIDRYSRGGSTLLYGASQGGEVVLKALPLVKPRRVEAVILVNPVTSRQPGAPLSATTPKDVPGQGEAEIDLTLPRTLVLQGAAEFTPPPDLDRRAPLTVYRIEGAPDSVTLVVPECAAPLVRDFVEKAAEGGAPCAAKLTIRF